MPKGSFTFFGKKYRKPTTVMFPRARILKNKLRGSIGDVLLKKANTASDASKASAFKDLAIILGSPETRRKAYQNSKIIIKKSNNEEEGEFNKFIGDILISVKDPKNKKLVSEYLDHEKEHKRDAVYFGLNTLTPRGINNMINDELTDHISRTAVPLDTIGNILSQINEIKKGRLITNPRERKIYTNIILKRIALIKKWKEEGKSVLWIKKSLRRGPLL